MADIDLTVQQVTRAGVTPTYNSSITASDVFQFRNNDGIFVHISNGATPGSVTIKTVGQVDGLEVADRVVAIAASTDYMIGPFPKDVYEDTEGKVSMTFVTPATMEVGVIRV